MHKSNETQMKRIGWCIWTPWSGWLEATFSRTRKGSIDYFERNLLSNWRKYRAQGFRCRPVAFVALDDE